MAVSIQSRAVFFFDIDNCLYSKNTKIIEIMSNLIDKYFETHLSLSQKEAYELHAKYYQEYGLAIEGLVRHHSVDAMEFNTMVDDAVPLDEILKPDADLRKFLEEIDTQKVKLWLLTNAHITHGKRVVKLLGVEDLFEGITYCDYSADRLVAKPHKEMFSKAMTEAGATSVAECYFVDDSFANAKGAHAMGWNSVHYVERDEDEPTQPASKYQIRRLEDLRKLFPQLFKNWSGVNSSRNGALSV